MIKIIEKQYESYPSLGYEMVAYLELKSIDKDNQLVDYISGSVDKVNKEIDKWFYELNDCKSQYLVTIYKLKGIK